MCIGTGTLILNKSVLWNILILEIFGWLFSCSAFSQYQHLNWIGYCLSDSRTKGKSIGMWWMADFRSAYLPVSNNKNTKKNLWTTGTGDISQQLRVLVALPEDFSSIHSCHIRQPTITFNSFSGRYDAFGLHSHFHSCENIHIQMHTRACT